MGAINAEDRARRLWDVVARKGQSKSDRTRSGPWLSGRYSLIRGPTSGPRDPAFDPRSLGSWGTDLAQMFHPSFIMPDAIDRASPYFSRANNSPDPRLETAPGSKTKLTDSFFGPTSSRDFQGQGVGYKTTDFEHTFMSPLQFRAGSVLPSRSPARLHLGCQGHRQRHEARNLHVLSRFDHPVADERTSPAVPPRTR